MLSLLLLCAACAADASPPVVAPNIVLINVDDLGINDLGCYGRADHSTPYLDRLSKQGQRWTSAYCAQPICSPSRAALMTGRHPARLHLTTYLPGRADAPTQKLLHPIIQQQLPLEERTIAEYLKDAGYATACVGKWHLGGKGFTPDRQGFAVAFDNRSDSALIDRAIQFLDSTPGKPFFLYLALHSPHIPLAVADPKRVVKHAKAFNPLYAAMVEEMDENIGRVLTYVDTKKLAEKTVVVFVSDNGGLHVPELKDHTPTHNTPFRAGKGFVYEGGLRVPLIVRWPGRLKPGVIDKPVVNTDLMPTLLATAGVKLPDGLDGEPLFGKETEGRKSPDRPLIWHFPHYNNQGGRPAGAVRLGHRKLVVNYDTDTAELYDLKSDIGEEKDLASQYPDEVGQLRAILTAFRTKVNAQENKPNPAFDERRWRELYVDTDVSRLKPARTAAEMTPKLAAWRKAMDATVRK